MWRRWEGNDPCDSPCASRDRVLMREEGQPRGVAPTRVKATTGGVRTRVTLNSPGTIGRNPKGEKQTYRQQSFTPPPNVLPPLWRITLLGSLRVEPHPDGPLAGTAVLTRFRTRKTAALFACLAVRAHRPESGLTRDALLELLWPDSLPDAARTNLRVSLNALRHQLEPPGVPPGAVVAADRRRVALAPGAVATDLAEFEQALAAATRATEAPVEQARCLAAAAAGYRGLLTPEHDEAWLGVERTGCEEQYVRAVRTLIRRREEVGDLAGAREAAQQARARAPLQEEIHQDWIRLLLACGDIGAALRAAEALERLLDEELYAPPSPETRRLFREVQRAVGALPGTGDSRPPDSRDRRRPEAGPLPAETGPRTRTLLWLVWPETSQGRKRDAGAPRQGGAGAAGWEAELAPLGGQRRAHPAGEAFLFASATSAVTGLRRVLNLAEVLPRAALVTGEAVADGGGGVVPGEASELAPSFSNAQCETVPAGLLLTAERLVQAGYPGQALCSGITAGLLRDAGLPGCGLTDLGYVHLAAEAAPEKVYQIDCAGPVPAAFPPLQAAPGYQSTLPLRPGRLFGREEEVERLVRWLRPAECRVLEPAQPGAAAGTVPRPIPLFSESRLITLTGPGGVGKTRVALEVAHRLEALYGGAVWFLPLAEVSDPERVPHAVRDLLRLPGAAADPLPAVAEHLARSPGLLVLDNAEHVLDATADFVTALLARAPALCCLVTSRRCLALGAEREFTLAPLPTPDPAAILTALAENPSIQLFLERAQASLPSFQLTLLNAGTLAEVCRRLEGLPLALELAAPRVGAQSLTDLNRSLSHRLDRLQSRRRDLPVRHRTLRATLDWSQRLLPSRLRTVLAELTVFRGDWTAASAIAVLSAPGGAVEGAPHEVMICLEELREASLLALAPAAGGTSPSAPPRFRMLEMVREHAREQLDEEAAAAADARHREYFLEVARRVVPATLRNDQAYLDQVESELGNLRAALESAFQVCPNAGLEACIALSELWENRGYWEEGERLLGIALSRATACSILLRSQAMARQAWLALHYHEYEKAVRLAEEALLACRAADDLSGEALAYTTLALHAERHARSEAIPYYEAARTLFSRAGDRRWLCTISRLLAGSAELVGDLPRAREQYVTALREAEALGVSGHERLSLIGLARIEILTGEFASARAQLLEALRLCQAAGDRGAIAGVLGPLFLVAAESGDLAEARGYLREVVPLSLATGGMSGARGACNYLALLHHLEGREEDAARCHAAWEIVHSRSATTLGGLDGLVNRRLNRDLDPLMLASARARVNEQDTEALLRDALRLLSSE